MAEWPSVGRESVLGQVGELLSRPLPGAVVLAGAAGAGRSHTALECARLAETSGYRVERVLATHSAASIDLGAFAGLVTDLGEGPGLIRRAREQIAGAPGSGPVFLVVDDAHLLDAVSATLVLALTGDPNVFILATVRMGAVPPDAISALWKDAGASRIELGPLSRDDTTALLEAALDAPVASATVQSFLEFSGGMPLAIRDLFESVTAADQFHRDHGIWRLIGEPRSTPRLTESIQRRLTRLEPNALRLVKTLALGAPLPLPAIDLLGLGDALHQLEGEGLSTLDGEADAIEVRLASQAVATVVLDGVGTMERREILAACVDALTPGSTAESDRIRIMVWRLRSGRPVPAADLLEAARAAYVLAAYDQTLELAGAAWRAEPTPAAGHLFGFTLGRAGRCEEAEEVLAASTELVSDDRERVLVALARSENLERGLGEVEQSIKVCRLAEDQVDDDGWRNELIAHRAMDVLQTGDVHEVLRLVEPLISADSGSAPRAFVKAAYPAALALISNGRIDAGMALASRALPVHQEVWADDVFQTEPGVHQLTALFGLISSGRLEEADVIGQFGLDLTRDANPRYAFAHVCHLVGLNEMSRGRVASAGRHYRDAVGVLVDARQFALAHVCLAGSALSWALLGRAAEAIEAMLQADRLGDRTHQMGRARVADARGWVAHVAGEPDLARRTFDTEADLAVAAGDHVGAATLLTSLARCGGAVAALDRLVTIAEGGDGALVQAQVLFTRALATDDPESGDEAAEQFAAMNADLLAAEAASTAARGHARRGDPRRAARSEARSNELMAGCEGAKPPLVWNLGLATPLTAREREVTVLVAEGHASKEVARRLALSPRTVDNYLQKAYQKLGISNRAALVQLIGTKQGADDPR